MNKKNLSIIYFSISISVLFTFMTAAWAAPMGEVMLDDFEQRAGYEYKPNSLGYWSDIYVDADNGSTGGFIADVDWAKKNGNYGGCIYYDSNLSETAQCKFYSPFSDTSPYADLSGGVQDLKFWIKLNEDTPKIDKIILEGETENIYGQVNFSDYNQGSDIPSTDWKEIVIPKSAFLSDTAGGFSLSSVKLFAISFKTGSKGAILLDDIQIKDHEAPSTFLEVKPYKVSDDTLSSDINFGNVSAGTTYIESQEYLKMDFSSNYGAWRLEVYTVNSGWIGDPAAYRGGMLGKSYKYYVVPLLYRGYDDKQAGGVPCEDEATWRIISDSGDPGWQRGTTLVASGNADHSYLECPPNQGDEVSSPIYVYWGGNFTNRAAQDYLTTIWIDLYHE